MTVENNKMDLLCQITILPTKTSDFHRQSEFETIVNAVYE
jgi:hypothetical protein